MLVYIFVYFSAVLLFALGNRYAQKCLYAFALLLLLGFGGFRYGNGQDYNSYWSIYMDVEYTNVEFGYYVLCMFFKELGLGPQIMYVVSMGITLLLVYKAVSFYAPMKISYVFFVFLFAGFYVDSFNGVRQYIAIGFFFYATRYIFVGSFWRYAIVIVMGALFHYSILFLLPFYFLLRIKYTDLFLFFGMFFILGVFFCFPLTSLYEKIPLYGARYILESPQFAGSAKLGLGFVSKLVLALLLIKLRHRIIQLDSRYNVVINAFFFYVLFMMLFKDVMVFLRIAYYFHIFLILILPRISSCFSGGSKTMVTTMVIFYVFLLFGVQMSDKTALLIPYQANFDMVTTINVNR